MMRISQVCEKCEKEVLSADEGTLEINYKKKTFTYICASCGHINVFDFGNIQEALNRQTRLPGIGTAKY